jgi:hypothetical protein
MTSTAAVSTIIAENADRPLRKQEAEVKDHHIGLNFLLGDNHK